MATKDIRGTRTEKCIATAYLAESTAYTRYIYYAQQAEKEGYIPVSLIFDATAQNELHHSKVFFKMLQGGKCGVPIDIDAGVIADTASNLATAMAEEQTEGVDLYIASAKIAEEEGFDDIAVHFRAIATIENHHKERFGRYLKMVQDGTLWKRDKPVTWQCTVCGYLYQGTEPPQVCPACNHSYQHYIAIGDDTL
ncbi:MAG: rubrerythrin family protein [Bacteroidales bacterium]|nr:rubrerythrin family protein [Bacteroidales bacterium]